jgi:hypothetical protein
MSTKYSRAAKKAWITRRANQARQMSIRRQAAFKAVQTRRFRQGF